MNFPCPNPRRRLAVVLLLLLLSASAVSAQDAPRSVAGPVQVFEGTALRPLLLRVNGSDYYFKYSPQVQLANGNRASLSDLAPGVHAELHLRREGGRQVVERIVLLPN